MTIYDQVWPDVTRRDYIWSSVTNVTRSDQNWTGVTTCDQVLPNVTRCDKECLDVTRCDQCDQEWPDVNREWLHVTRCDQAQLICGSCLERFGSLDLALNDLAKWIMLGKIEPTGSFLPHNTQSCAVYRSICMWSRDAFCKEQDAKPYWEGMGPISPCEREVRSPTFIREGRDSIYHQSPWEKGWVPYH